MVVLFSFHFCIWCGRFYSRIDDEKCIKDCREAYRKAHKTVFGFEHEFMKAAMMEHAERLGRVKMKFTTEVKPCNWCIC